MKSQKDANELRRVKHALELVKKGYLSDLPHISMNHYKWSREYCDSTNKINLVSAANQIGKSVGAIRRSIDNITDPHRWEMFYGKKPTQLWYFYPDQDTLQREFETKWKNILPSGKMKTSEQYGWKQINSRNKLVGIHFKIGVPLYFFTYSQKPTAIQASTVNEVTCDEEPPLEFYDELILRLLRTDGIFNAIFTPTLGQAFWAETIETDRRLPTAFKRQISMYDCLFYEDGSPNPDITLDKIKKIEESCSSQDEINRRVHGKFPKHASSQGRNYYAFDIDRHVVKPHSVESWNKVVICDYGSGLETKDGKRHPSAILVLAISPDYREGRVIRCWRGDDVVTTAGDLFNKYVEITKDLSLMQKIFDPGQADFGIIAERSGHGFIKAQKDRLSGEEIVNSLFKYDMLKIFAYDIDDPTRSPLEVDYQQTAKLIEEALTFRVTKNISAKEGDDLLDCLRYGCKAIPWDFEYAAKQVSEEIKPAVRPRTQAEYEAEQIKLRRGEMLDDNAEASDDWNELEDEIEEWNELYG